MTDALKTLVALDHDIDAEQIRAALPESHDDIQIVGLVHGLDETWRILQETTTDVLVIVCSGHSERALYLIDAAVKQRRERPVIVLTDEAPEAFVRRAFDSGADDLMVLPETPEHIRFAIRKAVARKQGSAVALGGGSVSPMICILGPKGGSGKTVTASNLAVGLALSGHSVVLVDLDLQFGDVGLALGLAPEKTIYDLVKAGGTLDENKLDAYLMEHSSGARVLLAPTRPDQASVVTTDFLRDIYATLRRSFDFVIVDTPPGFTPEVIASIDSSSHICMVGMLDSLSLKNTKLGLETLDLMGYHTDRVNVVLNRADSRVGIDRDDVVAVVGRVPDVFVPSEREIPRSVNDGTPIVLSNERSDAARAFRDLAGMYTNDNPAVVASTNGRHRARGLIRRRA
jgi:pilus assembly protein CpaE